MRVVGNNLAHRCDRSLRRDTFDDWHFSLTAAIGERNDRARFWIRFPRWKERARDLCFQIYYLSGVNSANQHRTSLQLFSNSRRRDPFYVERDIYHSTFPVVVRPVNTSRLHARLAKGERFELVDLARNSRHVAADNRALATSEHAEK